MGAKQHQTLESDRFPPGRETAGGEAEAPESKSIPREYKPWDASPRRFKQLYGCLPIGCTHDLLDYLSRVQLLEFAKGRTYEDVPAKEWKDAWQQAEGDKRDEPRKHRIATPVLTGGEIAKGMDCKLRTVQYAMRKAFEAGVIARRRVGKKNQFTVLFDRFDRLEKKEPVIESEGRGPRAVPGVEAALDDLAKEETGAPAAEPPKNAPAKTCVNRTQPWADVPATRIVFDEELLTQFSFEFETIGGETRFRMLPLGEQTENASRNALREPSSQLIDKYENDGEGTAKPLPTSTFVPLSPSDQAEHRAISEAVEALQKRTGEPPVYRVSISGDTIQVSITPRGGAYNIATWEASVQPFAIRTWGTGVSQAVVQSIAKKCTAVKRAPQQFIMWAELKAREKTKGNANALRRPGQSPAALDNWADWAVQDWIHADAEVAAMEAAELAAADARAKDLIHQAQWICDNWDKIDEFNHPVVDESQREFVRMFFPDLAPAPWCIAAG